MISTDRSKLRRLPNRGSYDPAILNAIWDAAFLAHVGFQKGGQPFVIPTLYGREDGKLFLHGSSASRMVRDLSSGLPVCVTVTIVDGLVLARSAFHHSMNYRSAVAFGIARTLESPKEKTRALRVISEHLLKGRWNDVRPPTPQELKATAVLEFTIEEASAKMRQGPPLDDEEDYNLPVWAGVVPTVVERQTPIADPRLAAAVPLPGYLQGKSSS